MPSIRTLRTPYTHRYSIGFQREFGRNTAIEVRYVGNTNVGETYTWNINSNANWSMLSGENGFYRRVPAGRRPISARTSWRATERPSRSPVRRAPRRCRFSRLFRRDPAERPRNQNPASLHNGKLPGSSWYNQLNYLSTPGFTGIAGFGTSGLQNTSFANADGRRSPCELLPGEPDLRSTGGRACGTAASAVQRAPGRAASPHERGPARAGELVSGSSNTLSMAVAARGTALRSTARAVQSTPSRPTGSTSCPSARPRVGAGASAGRTP